jgi:hypothetical protein
VTGPGQKETTKQAKTFGQSSTRVTASPASKVLQIKRWEIQEGPFRGFRSPPGRF